MTDSRPIVVGGCYRSGTSLVRRILDSHPRIFCGPEVKFFRDFYADYLDVTDSIEHLRFMRTARSVLAEDELLEVFGGALIEIHRRAALKAGKPRWADKVPENAIFLEQWQRLLGDEWIFLHVVRNPLDTLASIEEWGFPKSIPGNLDARIDLYLKYMRSGLRFGQAHPDRYVAVVYEDLVADPESRVRDLMSSLNEEFFAEQLSVGAATHLTGLEDPKIGQAAGIHSDCVGRWDQVLDEGAAALIAGRTRDVWSQFGEQLDDLEPAVVPDGGRRCG